MCWASGIQLPAICYILPYLLHIIFVIPMVDAWEIWDSERSSNLLKLFQLVKSEARTLNQDVWCQNPSAALATQPPCILLWGSIQSANWSLHIRIWAKISTQIIFTWPWVSYLTSLCLRFFICKMRILAIPIFWSRSLRGRDKWLTCRLDPSNQKLLTASPVLGKYTLTSLLSQSCCKDIVLREPCVVETFWTEYMTEPS